MKIIKTYFNDALLIEANLFKDYRGDFSEIFNLKSLNNLLHNKIKKIVQINKSTSKKNVLRGIHVQTKKPQGKYIFCNKGSIMDVFVDLRKNSKYFGKHKSINLKEKDNYYLWLPPGFAHGFITKSKVNEVYYLTTDYYSPRHDISIIWEDKDLNIKWNCKYPILSHKDKNGMELIDFKNKYGGIICE